MDKLFGTASANGEAVMAHTNYKDKTIILAVKKIPLFLYELNMIEYHDEEEAMTSDVWIEIMVMKLARYIIRDNICPNFPIYIKYVFCKDCSFKNKDLKKQFKNSGLQSEYCIMMLNEYASGGDLHNWCKVNHIDGEFISLFFQIYVALYTMQKYFNMTHHDLHLGNVLVHNVRRESINYKIDDKDYIIDNHGYLFVLWDFGYCRIPEKLESKKWNKENYYTDAKHNQTPRLICDYRNFTKLVSVEYNMKPISSEMKIFFTYIEFSANQNTELKHIIPNVFGKFITSDRNILNNTKQRYCLDKPLTSIKDIYKWLLV
jgi:hypothetical protein